MIKRSLISALMVSLALTAFRLCEAEGFTLPGVPRIPHLDTVTSAVKETDKADRPISDEEEYYIGRAVAAKIFSMYPLLKNEVLTHYLNLIGQTIALHSPKPSTYGGYHFAILNTPEMNAFACPGGIILITQGMIDKTKNEDELAAVLAHEIAHINNRDGIASIKSARWSEALTVIGVRAASSYAPSQVAQLVSIFEGSINDVFKTLVVSGYSRSQEYAADEAAIGFLLKAGYHPSALKSILERLAGDGHAHEGGVLTSHPGTAERIGNAAGKIPPRSPLASLVQVRAGRYKMVLAGQAHEN